MNLSPSDESFGSQNRGCSRSEKVSDLCDYAAQALLHARSGKTDTEPFFETLRMETGVAV
jgi:hypothetical protein